MFVFLVSTLLKNSSQKERKKTFSIAYTLCDHHYHHQHMQANNFRETCLGNYFWHCGASQFLSLSLHLPHKMFLLHKNERKKNSRRKTKSIQWWKKKERNVMNMIMMKRLCVVDASRLVWWAQISRVTLNMQFLHVNLTLM